MEPKRFSGLAGEDYRLFQAACPHYDELQEKIGQEIRKYLANFKGKEIKVLEIGPGPGYTTIRLLEADHRVVVTAVDNDPGMIEQAKVCLQDYVTSGRVKLVLADALKFVPESLSSSFDAVVQAFTLHNFEKEDREKIMPEIVRVLRPGGIFVNGDKFAQDNEAEHFAALHWQMCQFIQIYSAMNRPELIEEWVTHYLYDNRPQFVWYEGEAINQLKGLGFEITITFRQQMEAVLVGVKS